MSVFKGDQAPGAFTRDSAGKITRIDYGSYFTGLASAGRSEADLLVVEDSAFLQAPAWLDHYHVLGELNAHLARERGTQPTYLPGTMALGQMNGRQIALPFVITPWLMRVDAVLFRAVGLTPPPPDRPWTWQQIIDLAPKLAQSNSGTGANAFWTCHAVALPPEVPIWQIGGDVVDASRAVVVDQPASVRGVTFWRDLATHFGLDALPSAGVLHAGSMPRRPNGRPYAIPTFGGGLAATTFDPLSWPSDIVAQHWDDGLAYAPVPFGAPGGSTAVTKLELQAVAGLSAGSRQPELAFAALRALEATAGPVLRLSAVRSSAEQFLKTGGIDARFAAALRWGIVAGRASTADALLGGTDLETALARTVPGLVNASNGDDLTLQPHDACAEAAALLRDAKSCGNIPILCLSTATHGPTS
ncbi:MAG: ABC transporter substrate-binding protein [Chloroflexota bacterium]